MNSFIDSKKFFGFRKDGNVLCFDLFKAPHILSIEKMVYDVKILYDLEGKETTSLMDLAVDVLGRSRVADYRAYSEKMNAHWKSYNTAKINWNKFPIDKSLPTEILEKLLQERNSLIEELYDKSQEKEFYSKFYSTIKCLLDISGCPLQIDLDSIKDDKSHFSNLIRSSVRQGGADPNVPELYLQFNPVGAKTGRLSFKKGTVNFYILPKELRKCLAAPPNYSIVQLDFKSFQPRLAIFCTDDKEFKNRFSNVEDIYSVFPGDREENKISFISWMFSKRRHPIFDVEASAILQLRKDLYSEVRKSGKLTNKFGRTLYYSDEDENVVFQNYITSVEVDAIMSLMVKIYDFLQDRKSRIIMPYHDSLILYIHKDEMNLIDETKDIMENEHRILFGSKFPVSVKCGSNFGEMESL